MKAQEAEESFKGAGVGFAKASAFDPLKLRLIVLCRFFGGGGGQFEELVCFCSQGVETTACVGLSSGGQIVTCQRVRISSHMPTGPRKHDGGGQVVGSLLQGLGVLELDIFWDFVSHIHITHAVFPDALR